MMGSVRKGFGRLAMSLPLFLMAAWVLFSGCSNNECLDNKTTIPKIAFFAAGSGQTLYLDSVIIYGIGAPGERQLTDTSDYFEAATLPLRLDCDTTRYVFRYLQSYLREYDMTDTLTFICERQPWFVSSACGVSMRFHVKAYSCSCHVMDSIACMTPVIDNQDMVNFRLFFRVSGPEESGGAEEPEAVESSENEVSGNILKIMGL